MSTVPPERPRRGFDYASIRADRIGIDGAIGFPPPRTAGYLTFYLAVDDVETTLARAESLRESRLFGPDRISDSLELGMLSDPEGHLIGVLAIRRATGTQARA